MQATRSVIRSGTRRERQRAQPVARDRGSFRLRALRDLKGLGSDEAPNVLDVSNANQRVLLHRARGKVRPALEAWIDAA
jgi:hypothetical protein